MFHTATIPLNTPGVMITCQVSRGVIIYPINGVTPVATDPTVTISITNTTRDGEYQCYRTIANSYILVLTLTVERGG